MVDGTPDTVVLKPITKEKYAKRRRERVTEGEIKISPSPRLCGNGLSIIFFMKLDQASLRNEKKKKN
jgi:hypothetical protein